jgi:hypothetical protein
MSAKGQKRRQWTAEEKFKILEEGRQPVVVQRKATFRTI